MVAVEVIRVGPALVRPWWLLAMALVCFVLPSYHVQAGIVVTGDVQPGLPWDSTTTGYVGRGWNGSLTVDGGSTLSSTHGYLGYNAGVTGTATVRGSGSQWNSSSVFVGWYGTGMLTVEAGGQVSSGFSYLGYETGSQGNVTVRDSGSKWTTSSGLYVGRGGTGRLTIEAGGQVSSPSGYLGNEPGSQGNVTVRGSGSKWTISSGLYVGRGGTGRLTVEAGGFVSTGTLFASSTDLYGDGTIAAKGAVLDADLVFDATRGLQQTLPFGSGGTLNLDIDGSSSLGAGYRELGTLTIADGRAVSSNFGYLGYHSNSVGTAVVRGSGSKWTNLYTLYVSFQGRGTLVVEDGGQVSSGDASLGGTTVVRGSGSSLISTGRLYTGEAGRGTLTVENGGSAYARTLYATPSNLYGNGTITANGAILDADLVFDATRGLQQTLPFGTGGSLILDVDGRGGLGAGHLAVGALVIADGRVVSSNFGVLGYAPGSQGTAVVRGSGSIWSNSRELYVGSQGSGTLTVQAGAQVSSSDGYIGYWVGSLGTATVSGSGSTWTNSGNLSVGHIGTGTLLVEDAGRLANNVGYVGNRLDSHGMAVVRGSGSKWTNWADLYVGHSGRGTLTVVAGAQVSAKAGYLGYSSGSQGASTIRGSGSSWTNSEGLYVGYSGTARLVVEDGGQVSSSLGFVGCYSTAQGAATVRGSGSKWTNSGDLLVGYLGRGRLIITDGGQVSASSVSINNQSLLTIDVGRGSVLSVGGGTGPITNNGKVRILAGAEVPPGSQHRPILAGTWSGSGSYQAVGGTWDSASRVFTASAVQSGSSGTPLVLDLGQVQRALIDDPVTGWAVGCSFLHKAGQVQLAATAIRGPVLSRLEGLLPPGDVVLGGWEFTVGGSGYASGDPIRLSLAVGPGLSSDALNLWHYDGSRWSSFAAEDLVYTGHYASFTVTGLSGYAVSAVPEPGVLLLFGSGLVFALGIRLLGRGASASLPGRKPQR